MSALVLGIDTATERTVIALGEGDAGEVRALAVEEIDAPRAALGRLLPALAELLDREGSTPADISEVVVGRGPGSFTGVRIGVATAKGLAHGLGVALYGVGTLDTIAWRLAREGHGLLGVVGDAMRGEVYPALFELEEGVATRLSADRVADPADVAAEWAALGRPLLLAGNALDKHGPVFVEALGEHMTCASAEFRLPTGIGLLAAYARVRSVAEGGPVAGEDATGSPGTGDPGTLLPIYTRLSDAEEAERARQGSAQ